MDRNDLFQIPDPNSPTPDSAGSAYFAQREEIELRYQTEAALMYALSRGKARRAHEILSHFRLEDMDKRSSAPLRDMQNYLIILNTLSRKAVQQGGVHPLYIDKLSSSIARNSRPRKITSSRKPTQIMLPMYSAVSAAPMRIAMPNHRLQLASAASGR